MTELKHISTAQLINELSDRHGLTLHGFGCFYHILQSISKTWNCVASDGDRIVTTNFQFADGSAISVAEPRSEIVNWGGGARSATCFEMRVKDSKEIYGKKY